LPAWLPRSGGRRVAGSPHSGALRKGRGESTPYAVGGLSRELVPVKVRDLIKTLEHAGWRHVRTSGDHRVYRNPEGRITIVSGRLGDDVRAGTYRAVLRQTGIKEAD